MPQTRSRTVVFNVVVILAIVLQTMPIAAPSRALEIGDPKAIAEAKSSNLSVRSSLLPVARQVVEAQLTQPQPTQVPTTTILPPGTVGNPAAAVNLSYRTYLPLVVSAPNQPTDIALAPDTWMASTADWLIYERGGVTVRFPADWQRLKSDEVLTITNQATSIRISIEPDPMYVYQVLHPDIQSYQQSGYAVHDVEVKGLPAWEIVPLASGMGVCREVFVRAPGFWARFALLGGSCAYQVWSPK